MLLKLLGDPLGGLGVPAEDDHPGHRAVEPVRDAQVHPGRLGVLVLDVGLDLGLQGRHPVRGLGHERGRLVDRDQVVVFEQDVHPLSKTRHPRGRRPPDRVLHFAHAFPSLGPAHDPADPARKVATVVKSVLIAGTFVFCGAKVILISGTKANSTFSTVAPRPPAATATTPTATAATTVVPAPEKSP